MRILTGLFSLILISQIVNAGQLIGPAYYPPFESNKKVLVSQGFGGSQTHQGAYNYYAVDLVMEEGELVCAAREGKVIALYDGAGWFGNDTHNSNYVYILDELGNIQDYEHLKPSSIRVRVGDYIERGDCFAQVGNTGSSSGPHLHFAILRRQANGELASIPFQFIGPNELAYTPQRLQWVKY